MTNNQDPHTGPTALLARVLTTVNRDTGDRLPHCKPAA